MSRCSYSFGGRDSGKALSRHSGTELLIFWDTQSVWALLIKLQEMTRGELLLSENKQGVRGSSQQACETRMQGELLLFWG